MVHLKLHEYYVLMQHTLLIIYWLRNVVINKNKKTKQKKCKLITVLIISDYCTVPGSGTPLALPLSGECDEDSS